MPPKPAVAEVGEWERRERRAPVRKNPLPGAVNAVRIAC